MMGLLAGLLSSCASIGLKAINGLAKSSDFKIHTDISYGTETANKLDVYLPHDQPITATIIFFYGGCWGYCSDYSKKDYLFVAETLVKQGYAVIMPDYRKYPDVHFDAIIEDAKNATRWWLHHKQDYQLENTDVYLMGHSAGAHLAAMLTDDESLLGDDLQQITGFIGLAGPYDFYPFNGKYMYDLFSAENDYYASQPIHFVNGDEPPHLLLQGKNDTRVFPHNAINMAAQLKRAQVEHELVLFDKMRHVSMVLSLAKPFRKKSKVLKYINAFINKENRHH
jgi:acetyl esterase/lipase